MNVALHSSLCLNYAFVRLCEQDNINLDHALDRVNSTIICVTGLTFGYINQMHRQTSVSYMRCHLTSLWLVKGIWLVEHWFYTCDEVVIMAWIVLPATH